MVTVVFCYAQCNEPKVQIGAVREGHTLTVNQANSVLEIMANSEDCHGRVEFVILLDGNVAFKDAISIDYDARTENILTRYLQQVARHYDREGEIQKRNSILCLLGAIALDDAE